MAHGKFVEEVESALVETFIMNQARSGNANVQDIEQRVRNVNIPLEHTNVQECVNHLVESGHLRKDGNNLRLTDDGREDIEKVTPWFQNVPQILGGMTRTATTGGTGGVGGGSSRNVGTGTTGTTGGSGTGVSGAGRNR